MARIGWRNGGGRWPAGDRRATGESDVRHARPRRVKVLLTSSISRRMNRFCSPAVGRRRPLCALFSLIHRLCLGLLVCPYVCDSGLREAVRAAAPRFTFTQRVSAATLPTPMPRSELPRPPPTARPPYRLASPHALRWHFRRWIRGSPARRRPFCGSCWCYGIT